MAFTAIDVAIGLIFVYLLLSLMCTILQEFIANLTSWRGRHLRNGIQSMLNDPTLTGLAKRLYSHPRIATLTFSGKLPSYIPSATFARALADIVTQDNLGSAIDGPLAPFIRDAGGKVEDLEAEFTRWFDDAMDGFGGWYKRNVQLVLFVIGLLLAALFNVNSFEIARALWTQPILRDAVTQSAGRYYQGGDRPGSDARTPPTGPAADEPGPPQDDQFGRLQLQLGELGLPIGWDQDQIACLFGRADGAATSAGLFAPSCRRPRGDVGALNLWWEWLALFAGWLVTALATSLGSQFWFETLGEALKLRAAGVKPLRADAAAAADDQQTGTGT